MPKIVERAIAVTLLYCKLEAFSFAENFCKHFLAPKTNIDLPVAQVGCLPIPKPIY